MIGHPLRPLEDAFGCAIMPVGVLYFLESLPMTSILAYRVQCAMHTLLSAPAKESYFYCKKYSKEITLASFLSSLTNSLRDVASNISGSELRIYERKDE